MPSVGISESSSEFRQVRIAALLHDIGHVPFSHTLEDEHTVLAVIEKIRAYVEAGCTTPILRFASWDQKGQLARALGDVMPATRALSLSG